MTKRRRQKPYDPAAQLRAEAAEREREDRRAIVAVITSQPGETRVANAPDTPHRRLDVFALLKERGSITGDHEKAVRRLQEEISLARPLLGAAQMHERVQGTASPEERAAGAFQHAQRRVEALNHVAAVLAGIGRTDATLLAALLIPLAMAAITRWRYTVERLTGETTDAARTARIRAACQSLEDYYVATDNAPRQSPHVYLGEMLARAAEAA